MGIRFEDGKMIMEDDAAIRACPADPMEALQCDSCQ